MVDVVLRSSIGRILRRLLICMKQKREARAEKLSDQCDPVSVKKLHLKFLDLPKKIEIYWEKFRKS